MGSEQVSVIIPTYNRADMVPRAVESVLKQSRRPGEVIVVDDGSRDATMEALERFGADIIYVKKPNGGVSSARNFGIARAKGDWIAFLDSDDEWMPGKLERQLAVIRRHPELVWVSGNFESCLCATGRRGLRMQEAKLARHVKDGVIEDVFAAWADEVVTWTGTMLVKKQALEKAGGFDEQMNRAEDLDLWIRIALDNPRVGFVTEPLGVYHLHAEESLILAVGSETAFCDFIVQNIDRARQAGVGQGFLQYANLLVRRRIRQLYFVHGAKERIKEILERVGFLLSSKYRLMTKMLIFWPRGTRLGVHLISKVVRTLRLRKQVVRSPGK